MREILFRGKRTDNGEWVEGHYLQWPIRGWKNLSSVIVPADGLHDGCAQQVEVLPDTVGQYTGIQDKNGKPIFEGDILKWDEKEWGGSYREEAKWDYELFDMRKNDWSEWCEIIGNVHDNPELLK